MTKYQEGITIVRAFSKRNWMLEIEPYSKMPLKTFDEVGQDLRLRRVLKRAIMSDYAPQSLIDSIKKGIRG